MTTSRTPDVVKVAMTLLTVVLVGFLLFKGKEIFVPLISSVFLATLLLPLTHFLEKNKFPRSLAVFIPLVLALSGLAGVIYFLYRQIARFSQDADVLKAQLNEHVSAIQQWINQQLHISVYDQEKFLNQLIQKATDLGLIGGAFLTITQILALVVLIPVFTFLMLYYKELIRKFIFEIIKSPGAARLKDILNESQTISQRYLSGLLLEVLIMAVINAVALSLLGVKYALLLASVIALFNLIPYVGILIASLFCIVVTLISTDNLIDVVWVGVTLGGVQLLDNYVILPAIVGSKVSINSLATIIGLLVGGILMGVPGMFLAIPTIAVLKVIFDRLENTKPYGKLLGNHVNGKRYNGSWRRVIQAKVKALVSKLTN